MDTTEQFKKQQEEIVKILYQLLNFLNEGKKFGVIDDRHFIDKIASGIAEVESRKLKVALVGGFSEGKTSIIAAWSGSFNPETMKIDASESSDKVQVYHLEEFDLIDTPGLFGFKETADKEKYKDITRKYISEANLILYVMGPSNPIKDSHRDELQWLFKDLNLLPRTVFVISRFDEEVDIEDSEEYSERVEIKKNNILSRLRDLDIIVEEQVVPIVAVAANPFDEGFEYWYSNIEEYNRISHINDLQVATSEQIKKSGGTNALIIATSQSIVKDVIHKQLPAVEENITLLNREVNNLQDAKLDIQKEKQKLEKKISNIRMELKDYVSDLFTDLILQVQGTDMQTIADFFERNIGDEGIVLETAIHNEFERQVGMISSEILKTETSFNASINHYNNLAGDLAKKGVKLGGEFLKNINITNDQVLKMRDFIVPAVKFKPWGAVKIADKLSKGFGVFGAVLGLGVEAWDSFDQYKKESEFKKAKELIIENLNKQRKEYIEFLNNNQDFIGQFFSSYFEILERLENIEVVVEERQQFYNEFESWKQQGEIIEADFKVILQD